MSKFIAFAAVVLGVISGSSIGFLCYQYIYALYENYFKSTALLHSLTTGGEALVGLPIFFISIPLCAFFMSLFVYILPYAENTKKILFNEYPGDTHRFNWFKFYPIVSLVFFVALSPVIILGLLNSYEVYEDKIILYSPFNYSGITYTWEDITSVQIAMGTGKSRRVIQYELYINRLSGLDVEHYRLVNLNTRHVSICSVIEKAHTYIAKHAHITNNSYVSLEASNIIKRKCDTTSK